MKWKLRFLIMTILMLFVACGSSSQADNKISQTNPEKILVVYFSHQGNNVDGVASASVQRKGDNFPPQIINGVHKGNTQIIADYITEYTGGTEFLIEVENKYPLDAYKTLDVAAKEYQENARPNLLKHIDNIDKYDIIYLGYPIWDGTMPMPVFSFLEEYNFSGKIIIPFSTHDGSGLGSSVRDIKDTAKGATVLNGLAIKYTDVQSAKNQVIKWINKVNK